MLEMVTNLTCEPLSAYAFWGMHCDSLLHFFSLWVIIWIACWSYPGPCPGHPPLGSYVY